MTPHSFYTGLKAAGWTFRVTGGVLYVQPPKGLDIDEWHRGLIKVFKPALVAIVLDLPWTAADHLRYLAETPEAAVKVDTGEDMWEGIIHLCYRRGVAP